MLKAMEMELIAYLFSSLQTKSKTQRKIGVAGRSSKLIPSTSFV